MTQRISSMIGDAVGAGRDRDLQPQCLGHLAVRVVEVAPVRLSVEFTIAAALQRRPHDALEVDLERAALAEKTAGERSAYAPAASRSRSWWRTT
jgi:hypothetical protein